MTLCGAKTRAGTPCAKPAGWGTDHPSQGRCRLHGGNTPNGRLAAQREQARRAVAALGLPVDIDPHTALLDELHRTAGHVGWLGDVVAQLDREQLVHGAVKIVHLPDGSRIMEARAGANVWVRLYQQERAHLARVAKAAIDTGVAERQIRIAEQQAAILAQAIAAVLVDLGLDPADEQVRFIVRHRLAQASSGRVVQAGRKGEH